VVTVFAQHQAGAMRMLEDLPVGVRVGNAVVSYARYLGLFFWPAGLAALYPHPGDSLTWRQVAGAAVLIGLLTLAAVAQLRRRPYLIVGWLWFLGVLFPVMGLMQVGNHALADRFMYVPSIGLSVCLAWGAAELADRRPRLRPLLAAGAAGVLVALSAATWEQIGVWHDSRSLWEHALAVTDDNDVARTNLGFAILEENGDPREAEEHLRAAIRMRPGAWRPYADLGVALDRQVEGASPDRQKRLLREAIACYRHSLAINPGQVLTRNYLAVDLGKQGKVEEAIRELHEALRYDPASAYTYHNLAVALSRRKRYAAALDYCRRSVELDPRAAAFRMTFAYLLWQQGQHQAAAVQLREARRLSRRPR
jgi:Flp pilus assembly protein TadD